MPTAKVIDLSHHNSIPNDLIEARNSGIIGVIHKFSEGSSYIDGKVQARYYLAQQAGLAWGLYHFLRPGNMRDQASFFVHQAYSMAVLDDRTLLAADHEDPGVSFDQLMAFLAAVEKLADRVPVIYSGHVLKEQCKSYPNNYRLWLAQYSSAPTLPAGCDDYYLWQFSDQGQVPGITPPTDVNAIGCSETDFLTLWPGRVILPPEPVPPEQVPTITLSSDQPVILRIRAGDNVEIIE